jgi:fibronectin-binding autotransporter adhesin
VIGAIATAQRDGHEVSAALQARHPMRLGVVVVTPRAGVQYEHLSLEGATDRGAAPLNLTVAPLDTDSLRPFVGVSGDAAFTTGNGVRIVPGLRLVYAREVLVANRSALTTAGGEVFRPAGVDLTRDFHGGRGAGGARCRPRALRRLRRHAADRQPDPAHAVRGPAPPILE